MKYDQGPRSLNCQLVTEHFIHHLPNIEPASNHPLGDGVQLLHAKLHEEGRGGHHEAVASEHRDIDHHLEHPHAAELNHLQRDQGQEGEHQASCDKRMIKKGINLLISFPYPALRARGW